MCVLCVRGCVGQRKQREMAENSSDNDSKLVILMVKSIVNNTMHRHIRTHTHTHTDVFLNRILD